MKIDIQKLHSAPYTITLDHVPGYLDMEGGDYEVTGRIKGSLTFSIVGSKVYMSGRLKATIRMECARCLSPVDFNVDKEVSLYYLKKSEKPDSEDLRLDENEVSYFSGKILAPEKDIRDLLLVDLPDYPHCKESCLGLCPVCGANLNNGKCGCEKSVDIDIPKKAKNWKDNLKNLKNNIKG
jgi:DUF177 domain-containing protein